MEHGQLYVGLRSGAARRESVGWSGWSELVDPQSSHSQPEQKELARKIEFHFVRGMDEVLALALAEPLTPARRVRSGSSRVHAQGVRAFGDVG